MESPTLPPATAPHPSPPPLSSMFDDIPPTHTSPQVSSSRLPPPQNELENPIFTPIKRVAGQQPLFMESPGSSMGGNSPGDYRPAKRARFDQPQSGPSRSNENPLPTTSTDPSAPGINNNNQQPVFDPLTLFDDIDNWSPSEEIDIDPDQAGGANMQYHAGTNEGGLAGNAMDPLSMGGGVGGLMGGDLGGGEGDAGGLGEMKVGRRVMPKLDQERLLGKTGFPALIKESKRFKIKGKGHEAKDLDNLLEMYKLWGHHMFPRSTFGDLVQRVEGLCHSRLMHNTLNQYKEEYQREINPPKEPTPDPDPEAERNATNDNNSHGDADGMGLNSDDELGHGGSGSGAWTRGDENPFLDDRDQDAVGAASGSGLGSGPGSGFLSRLGSGGNGTTNGNRGEEDDMPMDPDEEMLWAEMTENQDQVQDQGAVGTNGTGNGSGSGSVRQQNRERQGMDVDDFEEDWAALDEM